MYNWSVDRAELKRDRRKYAIWELEQMVNFGLNGKKLKASDLRLYWNELRLDPARKRFLRLLLNG